VTDPAHEALLEALAPVRLPASMAGLGLAELVALLSLGLIGGVVVAAVLLPLTRRRTRQRRQRLSDLRALPVPERLLVLARTLGRLPPGLRDAAYGAAPPPSDRQIERSARLARLSRLWARPRR